MAIIKRVLHYSARRILTMITEEMFTWFLDKMPRPGRKILVEYAHQQDERYTTSVAPGYYKSGKFVFHEPFMEKLKTLPEFKLIRWLYVGGGILFCPTTVD